VYDMIVVGGRVAGASTGLLAARAGLRVLVIDRARFPSDTMSTNYIHQPGVARLGKWGLLGEVIGTGCPELSSTRFESRGIVVEGGVSPSSPERRAFAPRRYVLDTLLIRGAAAAGAEVREGSVVSDLLWDGGRVAGVAVSARGGTRVREHARLVVGADGMRSMVASAVRAPTTRDDPRQTCAYYSLWDGMTAGYELYERPGAWVGAVPTNDAVLIAAYFPQAAFAAIRSDARRALLDAVAATAPSLADRMAGARQAERIWGTGDQQNFFRQAAGRGWALVGDSGHHKDSITARGITDAFTQAELLVSRVAAVISEPERLDQALTRYWRDRDALMVAGYEGTLAVAGLAGDAARLDILRAASEAPELACVYFDVVAGIRPAADLLAAARGAPAADPGRR
jgi:flavin-dependent dehydrogenase